jgi:hypothetical protein
MNEEKNYMEEKDLVEEIWKHRDDPEEWGEEAKDIKARPGRSSVVSFRLPIEELDAVEEAAERNEETVSQYIRGALALRLHGETAGSPVAIMYGSWGIPDEDPDQLMVNSTIFMGTFTKAYRSKASILGPYGSWQPLQQRLALW